MEKSKTQMDHGDFCSRIREEILQYTEDIRSPETARILNPSESQGLLSLDHGIENWDRFFSFLSRFRTEKPLYFQ
jgi:hypothetical protein